MKDDFDEFAEEIFPEDRLDEKQTEILEFVRQLLSVADVGNQDSYEILSELEDAKNRILRHRVDLGVRNVILKLEEPSSVRGSFIIVWNSGRESEIIFGMNLANDNFIAKIKNS